MFLGYLIGIFTVEIVADTLGMKKCLTVMAFPSLIFWIRTVVSTDVYDFYIARTVAGMDDILPCYYNSFQLLDIPGLTGGALLRIVPLFIEEIADSKTRKELNAYFPISMSFGILLIYVIGSYINYFIVPLIFAPILVLYFILMMFLPETPQYLLKKMKDEEALSSLKFYRNCNEKNFQNVEAIKNELETMRRNIFNVQKEEVQIKDFCEIFDALFIIL